MGDTMKEIKKWDFSRLIKSFENDIIYGCHSFRSEFERSFAQRELVRRGQRSLKPLIEYICACREKPPTSYPLILDNLTVAWGKLFHWIEDIVDPDKTGPQDLRDIEGWIAWAERFAV